LIKLTPSQSTFVRTFPRWFTGDNPIAILQGDGGVGKTFSLKVALDSVSTLKKSALIIAETNEAVNVLRSSLGSNYPNIKTVCSAFNLVVGTDEEGVKGQVQHREPEFEGITLLVWDEVSMASSARLKMVLDLCSEKGIYVLLVGDEDQLPPVDGILPDNDPCISPAFRDDWYISNGFRPPVKFNLVEPCRNTSDIYEFCTEVKKLLKPKAFGLIPAKYLKPSSFLKNYLQTPEGNLSFLNGNAVVLAYTNKRVAELNLLVRKELFGAESEESWLVGDRLIFRQPSKCFVRPVLDNNNYINGLVSQTGETFTTNTKAVVKGVKYKTVLGLTVVELYIHSNHYKEGKKDGYIIIPFDRKEAVAYWTKLDLNARFDHNPESRKKKYELRDTFCSIFNVGIHGGDVEDTRNDTKHSYSLTCHCSQGSSIPVVFVDEKDIKTVRNRVLKLKLQYVSYSRAVSMLVRLDN
jgi:hypothetical protein